MTASRRFSWDSALNLGGGVTNLDGAGSGSYDIVDHVVGAVLTTADANKLHTITSGSAQAFTLWKSTAATKGYRFLMHKKDVGAVDINAFAGDNIAGNADIENTTADPDAFISLYDNGDGSLTKSVEGRGLWI